MYKIKIIIIALLVSLIWGDVALRAAGPVDEAQSLFDSGKYKVAAELLEPVVRKTPRNLSARVLLGRSLVSAGQYQRGREALLEAESRGSTEASRWLAEYALDRYDASAATEHLDKWKAKVTKSRKEAPAQLEEMQSRAMMLENLLGHVEKIVIVDSIQVPEELFFKNYKLSRQAGKLLSGADLRMDNAEMVYVPENRREMIWAETDSTGNKALKAAAILDDGTMETPTKLSLDLNGDSDYPFLMPDGVTLYFANDGEGSLGGYDIYMTRREGDKCLEPLNMGMPYNSPSNDYMMALDESTGLGWWATDRNAPKGYVTIYTFIISDVRTNYPADEPRIGDFARITSIAETQEGADVNTWKEKIEAISADDEFEEENSASDSFVLSLGDGRVIYTLDDLENSRALDAAKQLLRLKSTYRSEMRQLEALREKWRGGDHSSGDAIRRLEAKTVRDAEKIAKLRNTVIKLETKGQ